MGRALVSPEMWSCNWLVRGLRDRLGGNIKNTTRSVPSGYLKADTTDSPNNRGFSLRVNRRDGADETASIMAIMSGNWLITPLRPERYCFLPDLHAEVDEYMAVVSRLGPDVDGRLADVDGRSGNRRIQLRLAGICNVVLRELDELAPCALTLAGPR